MNDRDTKTTNSIKYVCVECFNILFPNRALGLTTKGPQLCDRCGHTGICVIHYSIRLKTEEEKCKTT